MKLRQALRLAPKNNHDCSALKEAPVTAGRERPLLRMRTGLRAGFNGYQNDPHGFFDQGDP